MQISFTFRNMKSSDALKEYATDKCDRLTKYLAVPIDVSVVLAKHKYLNQAEIKVASSGVVLKSQESSEDMFASIDVAVDKIERQAKKYKDRIREFKPVSLGAEVKVRHDILEADADAEDQSPKVINSEELSAKPMSVDEAIMQMDLLSNDFLVFINSSTQVVNVIYRRSDGNIGLVEADQKPT